MADDKVRLHYVKSCNLGKLGADGVALKINFALTTAAIKDGPYQSAQFGLSNKLARGLVKALTAVLDEPAKPAPAKPPQH